MTTPLHYERRSSSRSVIALLATVLSILSGAGAKVPIQLTDVTKKTGIKFVHTDGGSGRRYIVETVCCGLALFDYDGDGDVDIYFLNGAPLKGTKAKTQPKNTLYRNDGNWKFTDVTDRSGLGDKGFALGVCAADYDNDGDQDVYLNNFGANVLYRNNGDGTFADVTKEAKVGNGLKVGAGACFLDMDKDGDLDLYVSNYVDFNYGNHIRPTIGGFPVYAGPKEYKSMRDTLYRNNGDGTFSDVSNASGIAHRPGAGMGMVCADYDNDGDTDIFVANDDQGNFLFRNEGSGKFKEVGLEAGFAYDVNGENESSMGVACGDYDSDGRLDFHVTNYQGETATLYRNLGKGVFEDATATTAAGPPTLRYVTWGNGFVDFDNDGDRDIFMACGHVQDNVEKYDDTGRYRAGNVLLMNTGKSKFVNVSDKCGNGLAVRLSSRGAAFDDLDNDGDIDVVILNSRREPTILRNDSPTKNHWLQIRLKGVKTNRDGVGARVKVVSGKLTQIDEVHSGRGYQSHYGMRMHFGLGKLDKIDRVEVRWIGGGVDVMKNVRVDQLLKITEGGSKVSARR